MLSDLRREVRTMQFQTTAAFDQDAARKALAKLADDCQAFVEQMGAASGDLRFAAEARYPDQVWELDLPLRAGAVDALDGALVAQDFHALHKRIFAVSDPDSHVEIIGWSASVSCELRPKQPPRLDLPPARDRGARDVIFPDGRLRSTPVYDYAGLEIDREMSGPALVEMPLTTVIIDQDARFSRSSTGSLIVSLIQ